MDLKKDRQSMFPEIEDWSDPQDHLRYKNNVKEMSHKEWLWFHPSAYNLINIGSVFIGLFMFAVLTIWLILIEIYYIAAINGVMLVVLTFVGIKKVSEYKYTKHTTLYDLFLRDYVDEDDEDEYGEDEINERIEKTSE